MIEEIKGRLDSGSRLVKASDNRGRIELPRCSVVLYAQRRRRSRGFAGCHTGLLNTKRRFREVIGRDAPPGGQQVVDPFRDEGAVPDIEVIALGEFGVPGFTRFPDYAIRAGTSVVTCFVGV